MIVHEDKIEWFFVTDHHDLHIGGYAWVYGRLASVRRIYSESTDDWSDDYEATPLNWKARMSARIQRSLFEMFVNRRWSYRNGIQGPYGNHPGWRQRLYYGLLKRMGIV